MPAPAEGAPPTGDGAPPEPAPGPKYIHLARPHELSGSTTERECLFCGKPHAEWQMFRKHVCQPCADEHLVPLEARRNG